VVGLVAEFTALHFNDIYPDYVVDHPSWLSRMPGRLSSQGARSSMLSAGPLLPLLLLLTAPPPPPGLAPELAHAYAEMALQCVHTEYPNKTGQVLAGDDEVLPPRALHPAFYGCFDWHSSVHGHWALVRQLRVVPDHPDEAAIRAALDRSLTPEAIAGEVAYFEQAHHRTYERPYGWAWLLRLAAELHTMDDPDAKRWAAALRPLEELVVERLTAFLPLQNHPIRVGTHASTAYALTHALDYAREVGDAQLEALIVARSRDYFLEDRACPLDYEPSGADFLSPCLEEADLMWRVLPAGEFEPWLAGFMSALSATPPGVPLQPAEVLDLSDPKLIHLVGLNLSRAWCLEGLADSLGPDHAAHGALVASANEHAEAGMALVRTGEYGGEHWLATFAVYLLTF
jgi:hypothetical protein